MSGVEKETECSVADRLYGLGKSDADSFASSPFGWCASFEAHELAIGREPLPTIEETPSPLSALLRGEGLATQEEREESRERRLLSRADGPCLGSSSIVKVRSLPLSGIHAEGGGRPGRGSKGLPSVVTCSLDGRVTVVGTSRGACMLYDSRMRLRLAIDVPSDSTALAAVPSSSVGPVTALALSREGGGGGGQTGAQSLNNSQAGQASGKGSGAVAGFSNVASRGMGLMASVAASMATNVASSLGGVQTGSAGVPLFGLLVGMRGGALLLWEVQTGDAEKGEEGQWTARCLWGSLEIHGPPLQTGGPGTGGQTAASTSLTPASSPRPSTTYLVSALSFLRGGRQTALSADAAGNVQMLTFSKRFMATACERQLLIGEGGGDPSQQDKKGKTRTLEAVVSIVPLPRVSPSSSSSSPTPSGGSGGSHTVQQHQPISSSSSASSHQTAAAEEESVDHASVVALACSSTVLVLSLHPTVAPLYRLDFSSVSSFPSGQQTAGGSPLPDTDRIFDREGGRGESEANKGKFSSCCAWLRPFPGQQSALSMAPLLAVANGHTLVLLAVKPRGRGKSGSSTSSARDPEGRQQLANAGGGAGGESGLLSVRVGLEGQVLRRESLGDAVLALHSLGGSLFCVLSSTGVLSVLQVHPCEPKLTDTKAQHRSRRGEELDGVEQDSSLWQIGLVWKQEVELSSMLFRNLPPPPGADAGVTPPPLSYHSTVATAPLAQLPVRRQKQPKVEADGGDPTDSAPPRLVLVGLHGASTLHVRGWWDVLSEFLGGTSGVTGGEGKGKPPPDPWHWCLAICLALLKGLVPPLLDVSVQMTQRRVAVGRMAEMVCRGMLTGAMEEKEVEAEKWKTICAVVVEMGIAAGLQELVFRGSLDSARSVRIQGRGEREGLGILLCLLEKQMRTVKPGESVDSEALSEVLDEFARAVQPEKCMSLSPALVPSEGRQADSVNGPSAPEATSPLWRDAVSEATQLSKTAPDTVRLLASATWLLGPGGLSARGPGQEDNQTVVLRAARALLSLRLQRLIARCDPTGVDLDKATRQCRQSRLHSALAYLHTTILRDFEGPLADMLVAASAPSPPSGRLLLLVPYRKNGSPGSVLGGGGEEVQEPAPGCKSVLVRRLFFFLQMCCEGQQFPLGRASPCPVVTPSSVLPSVLNMLCRLPSTHSSGSSRAKGVGGMGLEDSQSMRGAAVAIGSAPPVFLALVQLSPFLLFRVLSSSFLCDHSRAILSGPPSLDGNEKEGGEEDEDDALVLGSLGQERPISLRQVLRHLEEAVLRCCHALREVAVGLEDEYEKRQGNLGEGTNGVDLYSGSGSMSDGCVTRRRGGGVDWCRRTASACEHEFHLLIARVRVVIGLSLPVSVSLLGVLTALVEEKEKLDTERRDGLVVREGTGLREAKEAETLLLHLIRLEAQLASDGLNSSDSSRLTVRGDTGKSLAFSCREKGLPGPAAWLFWMRGEWVEFLETLAAVPSLHAPLFDILTWVVSAASLLHQEVPVKNEAVLQRKKKALMEEGKRLRSSLPWVGWSVGGSDRGAQGGNVELPCWEDARGVSRAVLSVVPLLVRTGCQRACDVICSIFESPLTSHAKSSTELGEETVSGVAQSGAQEVVAALDAHPRLQMRFLSCLIDVPDPKAQKRAMEFLGTGPESGGFYEHCCQLYVLLLSEGFGAGGEEEEGKGQEQAQKAEEQCVRFLTDHFERLPVDACLRSCIERGALAPAVCLLERSRDLDGAAELLKGAFVDGLGRLREAVFSCVVGSHDGEGDSPLSRLLGRMQREQAVLHPSVSENADSSLPSAPSSSLPSRTYVPSPSDLEGVEEYCLCLRVIRQAAALCSRNRRVFPQSQMEDLWFGFLSDLVAPPSLLSGSLQKTGGEGGKVTCLNRLLGSLVGVVLEEGMGPFLHQSLPLAVQGLLSKYGQCEWSVFENSVLSILRDFESERSLFQGAEKIARGESFGKFEGLKKRKSRALCTVDKTHQIMCAACSGLLSAAPPPSAATLADESSREAEASLQEHQMNRDLLIVSREGRAFHAACAPVLQTAADRFATLRSSLLRGPCKRRAGPAMTTR
uniref:Vacuolar protein sorting-associated protein 8 central domain-containing protein n=1 Tax=Chromera velia CCMP2878 TaxID=1169474 RepID=A0A0G4HQ12_9ALVE|eukprot:Cvel_1224.t1-p1 / transcript=Cvel_1224.t1 / gene=Cvel_1224 / organism=Chromera_velia_CCMP2878 / gene_product=hypothetical protein / transcript_product=hypothetical protein / location=Cvel_scaffold41:5415-12545(-) / protein_length=2066 / sequence_SO=supercontig / SO=protein_coding / is_pseudo=false